MRNNHRRRAGRHQRPAAKAEHRHARERGRRGSEKRTRRSAASDVRVRGLVGRGWLAQPKWCAWSGGGGRTFNCSCIHSSGNNNVFPTRAHHLFFLHLLLFDSFLLFSPRVHSSRRDVVARVNARYPRLTRCRLRFDSSQPLLAGEWGSDTTTRAKREIQQHNSSSCVCWHAYQ